MNKTIEMNLEKDQIESLLVSAFEGGSNYWYRIEKRVNPKDKNKDCYETVFNGDGLIVSDINGANRGESVRKVLNNLTVQSGLQTMAKKYPWHFVNVVSDNADAETGDVFLQCCLFEEIIYG